MVAQMGMSDKVRTHAHSPRRLPAHPSPTLCGFVAPSCAVRSDPSTETSGTSSGRPPRPDKRSKAKSRPSSRSAPPSPLTVGPLHFLAAAPESDSSGRVLLIVDERTQGQYAVAKRILTDHQDELHRLAQALLEHETLNKEEIMAVIKGKKLTNLFYQ